MQLVCISDTHNRHDSVDLPDGDALIHAGDISGIGTRIEVETFVNWLIKVAPKYTHGVFFIAGNHDRGFDPKFHKEDQTKKPEWIEEMLLDLSNGTYGITYLENSSAYIGDLKIWGSPWSPWFHGDRWAFNAQRGEPIQQIWNMIPQDADIVVTHSPVAYKLDYVPRSAEYVGCSDLRKVIKKVKPKLHISGHIHEGYGFEEDEDTLYVNASTCDKFYNPSNKPWILNLNEDLIDVKTKT